MSGFPCHGCGQCCRRLRAALDAAGQAPTGSPYQLAVAAFPYAPLSDGSCPMLGADNRCTVYATRPVFCNVEQFYDQYVAELLPREAWFALNASACPPPE